MAPRLRRSGRYKRSSGRAHGPLELARDLSLMNRFRREVLEPVGINGLLNAFMLGRGGEIIGWIAVGTQTPLQRGRRSCRSR